MCIQSFTLLSKRELQFHGQLPPYTPQTAGANSSKLPPQGNTSFIQPRIYGKSFPSSYSNTSGGPSILRNNNHFAAKGSSLTVMHTDIPSFEDSQVQASTELSAIFDPDHVLANTLLTQLMSATSVSSRELCQPFLRHGHILTSASTDPIFFDRLLLDTGAQGSNFISAHAYSLIPDSHKQSVRDIDKAVRLGDARHLSVQLEVLLYTSIADSTGQVHNHHSSKP